MEGQLSGRVGQCVLRWFGHVERMEEERMAKKVMIASGEGNRCRSRTRLGWMDGWCKDGFRGEGYVSGAG